MSCCCCTSIEQSTIGIIEDFGKYKGKAGPGCHCLVPCKDSIAGLVSTRLQTHDCVVESKTKDNVLVDVKVSIQYQALAEHADKAFYMLYEPIKQIEAYVFNGIRGRIPHYNIDELFLMRNQLADGLKEEIDHQMDQYGYDVSNVLINEIDPAQSVKDAMDQIKMYQQQRNATIDKAEAQKILVVKAAEADAEAKKLSGMGLAAQRKAIVAGLQSSVEHFQEGLQDLHSEDVMSLLLMNQYFDTLKDIAQHSSSSTLFLTHAGGLEAVASQMANGILKKNK